MSLTENEIVELVEKYFVEHNVKLDVASNFADCYDLFKRPVIGHVVYVSEYGSVYNEPILMSDGLDESSFSSFNSFDSLSDCKEKMLSIIPAQHGTFAICGVVPESINCEDVKEVYMGLEYPGSPAVDWVQKLKYLWINELIRIQQH